MPQVFIAQGQISHSKEKFSDPQCDFRTSLLLWLHDLP